MSRENEIRRVGADALRSIVTSIRGAQLLAHANAINYEDAANRVSRGEGGHGTHGERGRALSFGEDVPLSVELELMLSRLATVFERKLEAAQSGAPAFSAKGDRKSGTRRAEKTAILTTKGPAIEVAYLYGWAEASVRRTRLQAAQDPSTGEKLRRDSIEETARELESDEAAVARGHVARRITASGRTQNELHLERNPTTEDPDAP